MLEKDGMKSAEVRKERKLLQQIIRDMLECKTTGDVSELVSRYNILEPGDITLRVELIDKQIQKALNGDLRATEWVFSLTGDVTNNDMIETKPPVFNIEVVDNSELERKFMMYEEASRTGKTIDEIESQYKASDRSDM